jgi:hypothetical protein
MKILNLTNPEQPRLESMAEDLGNSTMPHSSIPRLSTLLQNFVAVGFLTVSVGSSAVAATPSTEPFLPQQFSEGFCSQTQPGKLSTDISQENLMNPSLWWTRDEIAAKAQYGKKLIDRWIACDTAEGQPDRVDFLLNQQLWSLLDYLERYELVSRLGAAASNKNYNIRLYNNQGGFLAAYTCDFASNVATKSLEKSAPSAACSLTMGSGDRGFRGFSTPSDAPFPTDGGTFLP